MCSTLSPSGVTLDLPASPAVVQALVHVHSAGNAIGAHDGDFLQNIRAVLFHKAAGGGLHHAVEHTVGFLAGQDSGTSLFMPSSRVTTSPTPPPFREDTWEATAELPSCSWCPPPSRTWGAGAGRNCRDAASGAAGVDPQCLQTLAVIIHIVFVQLRRSRRLIVAVDAHGQKGSWTVPPATKGPFRLLSMTVEVST